MNDHVVFFASDTLSVDWRTSICALGELCAVVPGSLMLFSVTCWQLGMTSMSHPLSLSSPSDSEPDLSIRAIFYNKEELTL